MIDTSTLLPKQPFEALPVFLNSARPYVQGTQMVARTAEWITEKIGAQDITFTACAFRSITDQLVAIGPAAPADGDAERFIGTATFMAGGAPLDFGFYTTHDPAPRGTVAEPCTYRLSEGGPRDTSQVFEIAGIQGLEGLLVAMVQCLKTVHAGLAPDVHDIWFTGLRGAAIPCGDALADTRLTLTRVRMMGKTPN